MEDRQKKSEGKIEANEIMNNTPESINELDLEDQLEPQPREANEHQPHPPLSRPTEPNDHQENAPPLAPSTTEKNNSNTSKRFAKLKKEKTKLKDEIAKLQRQLKLSHQKSEKLRKCLKRADKTKIISENYSPQGSQEACCTEEGTGYTLSV